MADVGIPHFHNDPGVPAIHLGSREFMCIGATPPFDHPHVFLDMGSDDEIVCPYCSTLYKHRPGLGAGAAEPAECLYRDQGGTPYDLEGARGSGLR
jgi:uncharacterized Zn-finger protein